MKKWKEIAAVLGLALWGTCGGLVAGELTLRLVGPRLWGRLIRVDPQFPWLRYHPIVGWVNRPGDWGGRFHINALGFRGPEIATGKPSGLRRIVCLGDSRTFGLWLDLGGFRSNNDYPATLEQALHDLPGNEGAEVINAGVIGYTSAHGLAQLQTQVIQLHPDVITVAFGFNDHNLAWSPALAGREPAQPFARELFWFASHSYWFLMGKAVYDAVGAFHDAPSSGRWAEPEAYARNLRRIVEVGRSHGVRVLFVSQALRPIKMGDSIPALPAHHQDKAGFYAPLGVKDLEDLHRIDRSYRDVLYKVAEEEGVPVADAFAAFAASHEALFGPYDLVHCNEAGARVIAETIRLKLLELGWLPSPNRSSTVPAVSSPTER